MSLNLTLVVLAGAPRFFVHAAGGMIGLMGGVAVGPRIGKYARNGRPRPMVDGSFGADWNSVKGKAGVSGALATLFGGPSNDWGQLMAQIIGALSCLIIMGLAAWIWFKVSHRFVPLRTRREDELAGLDLPEVGAECCPDFHLTDKGSSRSE